jgi:hypothetical protein
MHDLHTRQSWVFQSSFRVEYGRAFFEARSRSVAAVMRTRNDDDDNNKVSSCFSRNLSIAVKHQYSIVIAPLAGDGLAHVNDEDGGLVLGLTSRKAQ